jgi:adenine deaminase
LTHADSTLAPIPGQRCRQVALGLEPPALVIRGGLVFSVFTGELLRADVALCDGLVAGIGDYDGDCVIDAEGLTVIPGLIDAHVHVESSLLSPARFAEVLVAHGVTTAMIEPHELTNILGTAGIEFFLAARRGLPVDLQVMVPSSVPASPLEQAAARITPEDVAAVLGRPGVRGLGEVMDYPDVVRGGPVWEILAAAQGWVIDGHAPGLSGRELQAYLLGGMKTDHETSDPGLLLERRRLGMWLLAREGSAARDLGRVLPFLVSHGTERTALCTDDRHAATLVEEHHIDGMVARLVAEGAPLLAAIRAATLNPATLYRLDDRGAVAPGLRADLLLVVDPARPHPVDVFSAGRRVVQGGRLQWAGAVTAPLPATPVRVRLSGPEPLLTSAGAGRHRVRVIRALPGAVLTQETTATVSAHKGFLEADPENDVVLLALLERHRGTGQIGKGFVTGLGLRRGAMASTVAHDAHHLMVAGADGASMLAAVEALTRMGGGLAVAEGEEVEILPLPLAGLMTDRPAPEVARKLRRLEARAAGMGVTTPNPFMLLSFLSLSVVPTLKITVSGLLEVDAQRLVPVLLD